MKVANKFSFTWFARFCLVVLASACVLAPAFAQIQNGVFTGTVTDQTGAVVPNAEVSVINVGTAQTVTIKTDANGSYRVSALPIGAYKINVTAPGFKTAVRTGLDLSVGTVQRIDFQLQLGEKAETVTVEATASLVIVDDVRLYETVGKGQVANLPLNGRNVYDLMQMTPGALNVTGVSFENGENTVVNGMRPNFSGFLINGVSNKGLSGGASTTPNADIVEEFQMLTLNMSAQYGTSAGAVVNVVTKSGTNTFHGTGYEFFRDDALDANPFFRNQAGVPRQPLRFNQFGVTATGPIFKDKLFFSASYQGERFNTSAPPTPIGTESPEWRTVVVASAVSSTLSNAAPNPLFRSTAALIYKDFPTAFPGNPLSPLSSTLSGFVGGAAGFASLMCADSYPTGFTNIATKFQALFGVTAADQLLMAGCSVIPALTPGFVTNRNMPFINDNILSFGSQSAGNLYNGNEFSARLDYLMGKSDKLFGEFYWQKSSDRFGPANASSGIHGFKNPFEGFSPNFQANWIHTFSPNWINEARIGYQRNRGDIRTATPGVPSIGFGDGSAGFGSYNGYPQLFRENVYSYSEMMSFNKGKHSIKAGVDFRRNLENSEFNVARPSYYFFDQLYFAADAPAEIVAGIDPGFASGKSPSLDSNVRYWRNLEMGAFIQDDWKARPNLTISIGMRYDLFGRHKESTGKVTTFIPGPGGITPANVGFLEWISNANVPAGSPGCTTPQQIARVVMAGVCGPGGFSIAKTIGGADHNNFGPRVGFAWDPFSNGKTSVRAGFGVSYEGTLYNPLSNSRWNPPFYSFNINDNALFGSTDQVVYGPTTCAGSPLVCSPSGAAPTYTGPPTNPGMGSGAQATGNISGHAASNSNTAFLTGIVYPEGIRDPYILNYYFGVQREIMPKTTVEINYVGTQGNKLFRAEQVNRAPGIRCNNNPASASFCIGPDGLVGTADDGTAFAQGRLLTGLNQRFLNINYGNLRVWENVSRSWYNSLQVSLRRQMSRGLMFTVNYTWSHSIDTGSGWHSGAVTANGGAAGDGYSLDHTRPLLDRGNSTFDIRHRLVFNYVWEFPWLKDQKGFIGHLLGGWQYNGIWSFQSGAHWTPYCAAGNSCDFNFDGTRNDRPDDINGNNINASHFQYANGYFAVGSNSAFGCAFSTSGACTGSGAGKPMFFARPCTACNGSLGRNTMLGPGQYVTDQSLFKNIKITERFTAQFRFEVYNAFNRTNFLLPSSSTGANFANRITSRNFGQSAGTLNPRNIQFGIKLLW